MTLVCLKLAQLQNAVDEWNSAYDLPPPPQLKKKRIWKNAINSIILGTLVVDIP